MEVVKATTRRERGSRKARALRGRGLIPGIIYGHGQVPLAVALREHDIELALHHGQRLLEVEVDGNVQTVLIKDVQWDTFGQTVLHVDLARVDLDERVRVTVPIILRGTPAGAADGGVLQKFAGEASVECAVRAIPEELRVTITALKIGDGLRMRDLDLPEGVTLLGDGDVRVCAVTVVAEEVEPAADEEAPEGPEVIGEKPEEAEGEDAGES